MKPLVPIIYAFFVIVASVVAGGPEDAAPATLGVPDWMPLLERWGIAGVMALGLWWAVKRIEASDSARVRQVLESAARLDQYHTRMDALLTNHIQSTMQVAIAIEGLAAAMEKCPGVGNVKIPNLKPQIPDIHAKQ